MATDPGDTLRKFINPSSLYSAAELAAIQDQLDTKRINWAHVANANAANPNPGQITMPRLMGNGSTPAFTTQRLQLTRFTAQKTETISTIAVTVHGTAAATVTLIRYGLYTINPVTGDITLVASTTNDATLLVATNTRYAKALTTPYLVTAGVDYFLGVLVVATTQPILSGQTYVAADLQTLPIPSYQVSGLADFAASHLFAALVASTMLVYGELIP